MSVKLIIILAVLCTLFAQCFSSVPLRHKKGRFCGSNLVKVMALICNKHYHSPSIKKSINYNQEFLDENSVPDYSEDYNQNALHSMHSLDRIFEDDASPFLPMRYTRQGKRGIYEECCENPCTEEDMRAYCY